MSRGPILERNLKHRTAVRYKLQLPVIFYWNDGAEHMGGGFTSDVALDGALILSSKSPPVGAQVRIEVLLPAPDHVSEDLLLECVGKVTRVLENHGRITFDVSGTFDEASLTYSPSNMHLES